MLSSSGSGGGGEGGGEHGGGGEGDGEHGDGGEAGGMVSTTRTFLPQQLFSSVKKTINRSNES